ncbi:LmeA family phospholipid-binding protein [Streptomyces sp. 4N509B]|uniref:LmeA family phospholipid-binding protein n=1 Tax=Streptomyces sp. 4N509B TaxID=3457413 RepID=UPI003FD08745
MRALRISLIVFGILVVLFVIADRVAVAIAQGEVASRTRDTLTLAEEPDVSIKGFPFLTQMLGGSLDKVTLGVDSYDAHVDGEAVTVRDLDIDLNDVEFSDGYSSATAAEAEGTGLIPYEEMTEAYGRLLGGEDNGFSVAFEHAGDGLLRVNLRASMLGQNLTVGHVTGELVLEGDQVRLEVGEEMLPDSVPEAAREQLTVERTISNLPNGLTVDSLTPSDEGLELVASGTAVVLAG